MRRLGRGDVNKYRPSQIKCVILTKMKETADAYLATKGEESSSH